MCDASAYGIGALPQDRGWIREADWVCIENIDGYVAEVFPSGVRGSGMRIWSNLCFTTICLDNILSSSRQSCRCLVRTNQFCRKHQDKFTNGLSNWQRTSTTYQSTCEINADALTRLQCTIAGKVRHVPVPAEHVLLLEHLSEAPLPAAQLET